MLQSHYYAAIDLGASSGRLILGEIKDGGIVYQEVHRFKNGVKETPEGFIWDLDALFNEIIAGLKKCKSLGKIPSSLAIDTWGVDYALLDEKGQLIPPVFAYRDARGAHASDEVHRLIPFDELYRKTGIQYEPFNTIYQLYDDLKKGRLEKADSFLMVPSYLEYLLTGIKAPEYCEASTSGLLDPKSKTWSKEIIARLGLPERLFALEPKEPPFLVGALKKEIAEAVGFNCDVVMVASHDTASSVVALPSKEPCLFLSSGTWSLLGIELKNPLITKEGLDANFTNEGGVHEIRYLKNIMGLWLVQCLQKEYPDVSFAEMATLAEKEEGFNYRLDIDSPSYLMPDKVTRVILEECHDKHYPLPRNVGGYAYAIYCSLANTYAKAIASLKAITGLDYASLDIVGGGSKNLYLNKLIAEKTGKKVILGSPEGTSLGNLALQALCLGDFKNYRAMKDAIIETKDR